jgi:hypothetical protein
MKVVLTLATPSCCSHEPQPRPSRDVTPLSNNKIGLKVSVLCPVSAAAGVGMFDNHLITVASTALVRIDNATRGECRNGGSEPCHDINALVDGCVSP